MDKLRRFVQLTRDIAEKQEELDPLVAEREQLEEELQTEFAKTGVGSMRVDGYTVYLEKRIWASYPQGKDAAKQALLDAGLEEYVKTDFSHQSVSSFVSRAIKGEDTDASDVDALKDPDLRLPPEFKGRLGYTEKFKVKAKRS